MRVKKTVKIMQPPYPTECVEFDGAKHGNFGYGMIRHQGKTVRAHRLSYCQANGMDLEQIVGLEVRHACDNPPCINPGHLSLGTHADNMRDMFERKRRTAAVGVKASKAKLNDEQVRSIRAENAAGQSLRKIAKRVGLNATTVRKICMRETWRHVE